MHGPVLASDHVLADLTMTQGRTQSIAVGTSVMIGLGWGARW